MRAQNPAGIAVLPSEIKTTLTEASKLILAKLITYYDEAVVKEQDLLQSLNDKLAELRLSPQEHSDLDGFQANISLKKEVILTKLEERRTNKIEKLVKPTEEDRNVGVEPGLPKKGRKTEGRKINLRISPGENNNKIPNKPIRAIKIRVAANPSATVLQVLRSITRGKKYSHRLDPIRSLIRFEGPKCFPLALVW